MMQSRSIKFVLPTMLLLGACAVPQTQIGSVSQDQIIIEQARQQKFVLQNGLKERFRLENVAVPLLRAAVPFCGETVRPVSGYTVGNAYLWKKDYFNAALSLGYGDTLVVMNVTPGMAAAEAGLKTGDRILAINGSPVARGSGALSDFDSKRPNAKERIPRPYSVTYRRGTDTASLTLRPELACAYTPQIAESDAINAGADGQSIFITTGILRFAADDNELAVVVGHELAHDAMHHMDAQKKNSMLGTLLGAVVDIAAATQGVNTNGDFTRQGAQIGSQVFSQDFEREADYVGLYILALAGRPIDDAPNFWRRMATTDPKFIKFATSHPTTAERFVRLDTWRREIERKVAMGQPLKPEMKKGTTALANFSSPSTTAVAALAAKSAGSPRTETVKGDAPALAPVSSTAIAPASRPSSLPNAPRKEESTSTAKSEPSPRSSLAALETIPSGIAARALIGAPSSDSARVAAIATFAQANAYMGSHQWVRAEETFRTTLMLDGSVPKYHAGLASLFMLLQRYQDAEAEYIAAVLLDLDNPGYRRLVKEARSKH